MCFKIVKRCRRQGGYKMSGVGKSLPGENIQVDSSNYRSIQFQIVDIKSFRQWLKVAWGMDVWFGNVPFMKSLALCNVLIWLFLMLGD